MTNFAQIYGLFCIFDTTMGMGTSGYAAHIMVNENFSHDHGNQINNLPIGEFGYNYTNNVSDFEIQEEYKDPLATFTYFVEGIGKTLNTGMEVYK